MPFVHLQYGAFVFDWQYEIMHVPIVVGSVAAGYSVFRFCDWLFVPSLPSHSFATRSTQTENWLWYVYSKMH